MKIIISGSIAYDYLMSYPGTFADNIQPDQLSRLSLSFLVDSMDKRRGGCAPNIAYSLALLGERPYVFGAAGADFGEYRQWLEDNNVDTSMVHIVPNKFTASFFCSTDQTNCQIASFYTGAMADARDLSLRSNEKPGIVIISPDDPLAMVRRAEECRELGIRFVYDPGQQCARSTGEELRGGIKGCNVLVCNDYEFGLINQKTDLTASDILKQSEAIIITKGDKGCSILLPDGSVIDVPAVPEERIVDPTGVGDAFRSGLLKGMALDANWKTCAQMGSVAATYALEHVGGQSHYFTRAEFKDRYEKNFGELDFTI
jgi:adenosine kinase